MLCLSDRNTRFGRLEGDIRTQSRSLECRHAADTRGLLWKERMSGARLDLQFPIGVVAIGQALHRRACKPLIGAILRFPASRVHCWRFVARGGIREAALLGSGGSPRAYLLFRITFPLASSPLGPFLGGGGAAGVTRYLRGCVPMPMARVASPSRVPFGATHRFVRSRVKNGSARHVEVAARRAAGSQVVVDAKRLIAAWNERLARRMPLPFAPTIGAALAAR